MNAEVHLFCWSVYLVVADLPELTSNKLLAWLDSDSGL
jgi:predicted nucleotidyltransferase